MSESTLVTTNLLRIYRPIALWFWSAAIVGIGAALAVVLSFTDLPFSLWVQIAGPAAKYWFSVIGVLLVSSHLKQFVATGVTRHEFLAGAGLFGLIAVLLFSAVVTAGHALEQWAAGLAGPLPAGYPAASVMSEFLHVVPAELGFLVSGAAIAAGFYRFSPMRGVLLILPGVLPALVSEGLLGSDRHGVPAWSLPLGLALTVSLLVTALVAVTCQRLIRDVTIRRTTG